jgi:hypothetical protein
MGLLFSLYKGIGKDIQFYTKFIQGNVLGSCVKIIKQYL